MQAMVNLPDPLYRQAEALAVARGTTVEQVIVDVLTDAVQDHSPDAGANYGARKVKLPLIRSKRPGTLDLSNFDFDDLLA